MSVYSQRSSSSKGSKRIAKNSQVDESLFGAKKASTALPGKRNPAELEKVVQEVRNGELKNPNAVIISHSELLRMKVLIDLSRSEF